MRVIATLRRNVELGVPYRLFLGPGVSLLPGEILGFVINCLASIP